MFWIPSEWITVTIIIATLLLLAGMILPFFLTVATFQLRLSAKGVAIEVLNGTPLIARGTHFYAWKDVESYDMGEDGGNGMSYLVIRIVGPLNDIQLQNIRFEAADTTLAQLHSDFHATVAEYQPEDGDASHRPIEKSIWETGIVRAFSVVAAAVLVSFWMAVTGGYTEILGGWMWARAIVLSILTMVYVLRVWRLWKKNK